MFEEKLIVGRFVNFSLAIVATKLDPKPTDGTVVDQDAKVCSLEQSTSSGIINRTKTSGVVTGANPKVRRNFNFLTYYPGVVTQTTLETDVLTGPMSGCWIMLYKHNDVLKVGHVGTFMEPTDEKSIKAKEAWTPFAGSNEVALIGGFNPFTHWKERGFPLQTGNDSNGSVYALVTTARQFYSVYFYKQSGSVPNLYRIAGVEPIVSAPTTALPHI